VSALDQAPADAAFPTLTAEQQRLLASYGTPDVLETGDYAFVEGQERYDLVLILDGDISIVRRDLAKDEEVVITTHPSGRFLGELNLLTGERTVLAARAVRRSSIVRVSPEALRRLMAAETELSDLIFAALVGRRELLRAGEAAKALKIIGSRYSAQALDLARFVRRRRLPFTCIDLDEPDVGDVDVLLASIGVQRDQLPVVVTPTAVLRRPTIGELADHLGVAYHPVEGRVYDVAIVGGGPAGLAAAVYGASEGLDTLVLDAVGVGGQAGTSSRIENFFGFPTGLSGGELVERGALQAIRLGAETSVPCRVVAADLTGDGFCLRLQDAAEIHARAVVVALGVQYRKLALDRLADLEGAGVYYAATELEARLCDGGPVCVIGGGNSAGQAAVFLSPRCADVRIVIRGADLTHSMSRYLIDRIEAASNITVVPYTEVVALHGVDHLEAVDLRTTDPATGATIVQPETCKGVFSFIGAVPFTEWLAPLVALDERGFVLTDRDIPDDVLDGAEPLPFETSQPGIFAAGDVRHGSVKRVAAAVGEGSSAIRSVHDHLARALVAG
jgi:thioredoxin reductase (NADPH)